MSVMRELLREGLPYLNEIQRQQLETYYELLLEGNARMNLTALTEPGDVIEKHFIDCLLPRDSIPQGANCIDIGTGAGFPGIPLLIARPDIRMTLLDSLHKRVHFLRETLAALGLTADCVHARAEDAAQDPVHRGRYDIALSRAVAPLPVLLELSVPFVRVGGVAIAYKGRQAGEEIQAARHACDVLGVALSATTYEMPYGTRAIVYAKKQKATPPRYPRRAGEPGRKPL